MATDDASVPGKAIRSSLALVKGTRVHYRHAGNGREAVVLLHGFPQTGRSWDRVAVKLATRFKVIAPDLRGAGESQRPAGGYDKKTMAADIHRLVNTLDLGRIHLVGHDIGGMVAYAYAAQWPSEVLDLTMIEMLLPGYGIEAMYAVRQPGRFAHMPFFMTQDLPEWLLAGKEAGFLDWFIRNNIVDQSSFSAEDIKDCASTYARPGALRAAFDWFRAFWQDAEDNRKFAASKLTMPVLAIGAELSAGSALADSLRPFATTLRGHVYEGCGHFIPDEQPERLARDLATFFGEDRPDPNHAGTGPS